MHQRLVSPLNAWKGLRVTGRDFCPQLVPGWGVPRARLGQGQCRLVRGGGTADLIQQTLVLTADD